jgi:hypothetical protein
MDESNPTGSPAASGPTFFDSLVGIFLEPGTTFKKIRQRPVWLIPCLVLVLISVGAGYLIVERIGYDNLVRQQLEQSPFTSDMTREEKDAAIERALESTAGRYMAFIGPVFFPLVLLLLAGLLLLILMVLGHSPGFSQLFSVAVHSFLAYSVVAHALSLAIIYLAQDPASLDPRNLIQSHLGVLIDQTESPVLFTLAASFDLLTFYNLFLLSLGVSVICGRRAGFGTGLGAVLALWALWVIAKTGFSMFTN